MPTTVGWTVPPWPDSGDATDDILFLAIGRFLTGWEAVETTFAELYAAFVTKGSFDTTIAARAFGTIATFRGRSEMIEAAAEAYILAEPEDPEAVHTFLSETMSALLKLYRGCAARRNEIAHGSVIQYAMLSYTLGEEIAGLPRNGFVLVPPEYNTNKRLHSGRPKYVYNSQIVVDFSENFNELMWEANSTTVYLRKRHGSVPLGLAEGEESPEPDHE